MDTSMSPVTKDTDSKSKSNGDHRSRTHSSSTHTSDRRPTTTHSSSSSLSKRRRDDHDDSHSKHHRRHRDHGDKGRERYSHQSDHRHERRRHKSRDKDSGSSSSRRDRSSGRRHHSSSRTSSLTSTSKSTHRSTARKSSSSPTKPSVEQIPPPPPPPPSHPPPPPPSPPPPPPKTSTKSDPSATTSTTTSAEGNQQEGNEEEDLTTVYSHQQQVFHQQGAHDPNGWSYYGDTTSASWDYASQQQYEQYQASYYTDQQQQSTDPSSYYRQDQQQQQQHYYPEQTMESYYSSAAIAYPDDHQQYNPAASYSALEEIGYPYPTFEDPSILFEKIGQVGEGTYGKVYKARNCKTGQLMALKRIRMKTEKDGFPITAMREIKLLQKLKHERIVLLQEIMVSKGSVYMVLEYMDHDLSGILGNPDFRFEPAHAKSLTKQILQGLAYLHHMGILHRDMKGSNLLVNNKGELKIADFGLARVVRKHQPGDYTNRVITLWYRPPELLLGATTYDAAVDIWGVGCIMMEFFVGSPIFNGTDEISQLDSIYRRMGTPTKDTWPTVEDLPWYELVRPKELYVNVFRDTYKTLLTPGALALAEALLSMDPHHRPTAAEALEFDYFKTEEPKDVLPENLMDMNDDWHDFESKQRKRKQTNSQL